ncbi:restriction endonuclease subunit S [Chloroflexota bacterium]
MVKKFKDYVIEPIQDNWIVDRIGDLLLKEFSGTWGPENADGINVLRSTNFQNNGYLNLDSVAVREIGENYPSEKIICFGDILLERSGGGPQQPVGRVSWCDDRVVGWAFSNFCQLLRPSVKVDNKFLFFALHYLHLRNITLTYQNQTTGIRNLEYKSYLKIPIPLPPLPEQRKISEILSMVDDAIEKTDTIIQQTQQLKKGLMQKLFTEGIGHARFKETKIGRIPEEWEVVSIKDIGDVKGGKRLPKGEEFAERKTEYPYIRVIDFQNMSICVEQLEYLTEEVQRAISRYTISCNDIYISIAGTIGLVGTIPHHLDGANLTENAAKICNLNKVDKKFLAYYLSSFQAQRQISSFIGISTQPKLALNRIEKIRLLLPDLDEQKNIAEILLKVDTNIENEQAYKAEIEHLKKGLMQVLLTGQIRVKV